MICCNYLQKLYSTWYKKTPFNPPPPPPPAHLLPKWVDTFFAVARKHTIKYVQSRLVNKKTCSNLKEKKLAACWILQPIRDENWKKTMCWFWNSVWFVNAAKQIQNTCFSPEKRFEKVRILQCTRALLFLKCTKDELERRSKREERYKKMLKCS